MTFRLVSGDCLDALAEMPEASVDAVVTDPPYGLEFMGKDWDAPWKATGDVVKDPAEVGGFQDGNGGNPYSRSRIRYGSGNGFQQWTEAWATELLRVLKPGGHLLAFGGTRTYHRLACGIEDAGFEVRDCLAWMYGSGFPKSLDVSKAIDKRGGVVAEFAEFRDAVIAAMDERGIKRKDLQHALGNFMLAHYLTKGSQPAVPNLRDYRIIRDFVGLGDQFDELFRDEAEREVVGKSKNKSGIGNAVEGHYTVGGTKAEQYDLTAPATPAAQKWQGWGTALKPAFEPVILARKPLTGTVAANVQEFGTGALNIDGGRVAASGRPSIQSLSDESQNAYGDGLNGSVHNGTTDLGRWPANVILDPEAGAMLDEQSGETTSHSGTNKRDRSFRPGTDGQQGSGNSEGIPDYGDTGGASRFYYCAKASRAERNAGLDGFEEQQIRRHSGGEFSHNSGSTNSSKNGAESRNSHPTVKPLDLMRYLVRLVTPPGGTVLDPFTGSGTTGIAAGLEGFDFIGIEREAEYREIAEARLKWWADQEGDTAEILQRAGLAEKKEREAKESGQVSLFDGKAA